ncbi:MAG: hypothetical protein ACRENH_16225 [Gemmatimonadaceae bacterium]
MTDLRSQLQSALGSAYSIERELDNGEMSRAYLGPLRMVHRRTTWDEKYREYVCPSQLLRERR